MYNFVRTHSGACYHISNVFTFCNTNIYKYRYLYCDKNTFIFNLHLHSHTNLRHSRHMLSKSNQRETMGNISVIVAQLKRLVQNRQHTKIIIVPYEIKLSELSNVKHAKDNYMIYTYENNV